MEVDPSIRLEKVLFLYYFLIHLVLSLAFGEVLLVKRSEQ